MQHTQQTEPIAERKRSRRPGTQLDLYNAYLREISVYPVLDRETEVEIGRRAFAGDQEAQELLIKHNLRFVANMARLYWTPDQPLLDVIADGNVGLCVAARAQGFDPSYGVRFISYASHFVREHIVRGIVRDRSTIRRTRLQTFRLKQIRSIQSLAYGRLGRELTEAEVAEVSGYSEGCVRDIQNHTFKVQSYDMPLQVDDETTLADHLADTQVDDAATDLMAERRTIVAQLLRTAVAHPLERAVLIAYYGTCGGFSDAEMCDLFHCEPSHVLPLRLSMRDGMTVEAIGQLFGFTREWARQLRERGLRQIRAQHANGRVGQSTRHGGNAPDDGEHIPVCLDRHSGNATVGQGSLLHGDVDHEEPANLVCQTS